MPGVKGICHICGKQAQLRTCWRCGRLVCDRCFDKPTGLCASCAEGTPRKRQFRQPQELNIPDSAKPTSVSPGDVRK